MDLDVDGLKNCVDLDVDGDVSANDDDCALVNAVVYSGVVE